MPYQMLCNDEQQKSPESRSGLGSTPSCCTPLHNIWYGIVRVLHVAFSGRM